MNLIEQLCPNCGLCCDSTLFRDAELQRDDNAERLAELGLSLEKKGRGKLIFTQPCACFDGKRCGIYADRPERCQTFECGLLKRVGMREMTASAALEKIFKAKKCAKKVQGLLRQLGQNDERMAMTKRYAQAMNTPIDLSDDGIERRGELMLAVDELMKQLQREFLK